MKLVKCKLDLHTNSDHAQTKLSALAEGGDHVTSGVFTISDGMTYALTNPLAVPPYQLQHLISNIGTRQGVIPFFPIFNPV